MIGRFVSVFRIDKFRRSLSMEAAIWASLMALATVNDGGRDGVFATVVNNEDNVMAAVIGGGNGYIPWRQQGQTRVRASGGAMVMAVMGEGGCGKQGCGARVKAYRWQAASA